MSTALNDQDFPDGVSSEDRLDVFASHYAAAGMAPARPPAGTAVPGAGSGHLGDLGTRGPIPVKQFDRYHEDIPTSATQIETLYAAIAQRDKEIKAQDQELKDRARQILHDAAQVELLDAAVKARDETIKSLHAAKPGMTKDQAKRFAAALEDAQSLRAELQKRDQQISRTTDVLGIVKWLCLEVDAFLPDADGKTHAEALHHIHTLIGLI